MSSTTDATYQVILSELKDIKELLSGKVPPVLLPVPPPPLHPKEKLIQLISANQFEAAFDFLGPFPLDLTEKWGSLPANLLLQTSALFFRCMRLGLIDLETTASDNLQRIFDGDATHTDRDWFLLSVKVSPAAAERMRNLKRNRNSVPVHLIMWLCTKPACVERLTFCWKLADTHGASVFPVKMGFWSNQDCFVNGDLMNPDFVKFWAENVLVCKRLNNIAL